MRPWRDGRDVGAAATASRIDRRHHGVVREVGQADGNRHRGQPDREPGGVRNGPDLRHRCPGLERVTVPVGSGFGFGVPVEPATPNPSTSPITTTSPLPVGNLPGITSATTPSSTLSPGGNAGNLFPTLDPSSGSSTPNSVKGRPVADTTALPEGASVLGASLIGLLALALAFVLAVTRFSIRRRPAPSAPGAAATPGDAKAQDPPSASTGSPPPPQRQQGAPQRARETKRRQTPPTLPRTLSRPPTTRPRPPRPQKTQPTRQRTPTPARTPNHRRSRVPEVHH